MATVKLCAESKFGFAGQYIARIQGRATKFQFARQFVGSKFGKRSELSSFETDEIGLYEECDVSKNGRNKTYPLVLPWHDEIRKIYADLDDALKIAKRLDDGEKLEEFVRIELGEPLTSTEYYYTCQVCSAEISGGTHARCPDHPDRYSQTNTRLVPKLGENGKPLHALIYTILSKSETKKEVAAGTIDSAVAAIVAALAALPASQQRKVLTAVRAKLLPPAPALAPAENTESESADV